MRGIVFLRILDRLEEIIIASLIGAATLLIFVSVVQRYLIGEPFLYPYFYDFNITWAQELCIYMFVWMAKFGAAYGVRTGIHVGVDVIVNMLQPKYQRKVVLFGLLAGAFFTFTVGTMGAKFIIELSPTDQVSPNMEMPRWISFLYVMTEVPIEAVALKLFTGIESFEIMAIPFFILAGNFLTHGGVARRMIRFATTMVGHWHGGLGLAA